MLSWLHRYAHLLSGPRRTPLADRHMAYLLVVIAGALNSVGFVAVGLYTSHMTGMTASAADHLTAGDWGMVAAGALGLASFVLGAVTCAVLFAWGRRRRLSSRYANVLVLEGLLILGIGLFAGTVEGPWYEEVLVAPLCFTMGLQNALITRIRDFPVRTSHVTGMVTDIAVELGKLAYPGRAGNREDAMGETADRDKIGVLGALVGLFFLGGVIGTVGHALLGFGSLVFGALLILMAALPPVVRDLRGRSQTARRRRRPVPA